LAIWRYRKFRGGIRDSAIIGSLAILALAGMAVFVSPAARRAVWRTLRSGRWIYVGGTVETVGRTAGSLAISIMKRMAEQGAAGARNIVEQFQEATADVARLWNESKKKSVEEPGE
jgi:hypothetical protein